MKRRSLIFFVLLLVGMPTMSFAKHKVAIDRLELGAHTGIGFYVGVNEFNHVEQWQAYELRSNLGWPGIETFGFSAGYRFDTRWHVLLNSNRQRMFYKEISHDPDKTRTRHYYNAMWHFDAMVEYNLLRYFDEMRPDIGAYNVVPFIGVGAGLTVYNAEATERSDGKGYTIKYPLVGGKKQGTDEKHETNMAVYLPLATGVKWRINSNVQLKGSFQYQLYFQQLDKSEEFASWKPILNSNLAGGTIHVNPDKIYGNLTGDYHNFLFSLSVIINFGEWDEGIRKNISY